MLLLLLVFISFWPFFCCGCQPPSVRCNVTSDEVGIDKCVGTCFLLFIWLQTLIPEHRTFNGHSKFSKLPGRWKGEDPGFLCLGASQNLAALRWLLVLGANRRVTAGRPRLENDHMCSPSFWACGGWPRPHDFSTQIYRRSNDLFFADCLPTMWTGVRRSST